MAKPRPPKESPVTVRQLLMRVWALFVVKWQAVLVGSLSFTLLIAVSSSFIQSKVQNREDALAKASGVTWEQLRETVNERLATLSQTGALRIAAISHVQRWDPEGSSGALLKLDPRDVMVASYITKIGPLLLLNISVFSTVLCIALIFFLLLSVAGMQTAYEVSQKLPGKVVPMLGMMVWGMVRSGIWIPFVGPLIAIYYLPRLALAPTFLASGERGVFGSITESLRRTKKQWLTIFFCLIGVLLSIFLLFWASLIFVAVIGLFFAKLAFFFLVFILMICCAIFAFSLTMLTASLA